MVRVEPFAVEQWMDAYEGKAQYNIAETCCASISIEQLQALSNDKTNPVIQIPKKLDYGAIRGSDVLRSNLAALYSSRTASPLPKENILITPGAIAANFLLMYTLVGKGDHVICHYPTYQQLYSVPASLGADVDLWKARPERNWELDLDELKQLIKPNTKLIIINNPNNPTGQILKKPLLQELISIASEHSIPILSDEVYRPIFHGISPTDPAFPPSILSLGYAKTIATGSLSKAYSLAGIRTGWIASRDSAVIEACAQARDYTSISVSQLDEQVAAFALSPSTVDGLLARNIRLARANLALLERWIIKHDEVCAWVKPVAGTTAFVRFAREGRPVDSEVLCRRILESTGVLFLPGKVCFGGEFEGYVRIGYVPETQVLQEGLEKLKGFMRKEFDDVPLAEESTSSEKSWKIGV